MNKQDKTSNDERRDELDKVSEEEKRDRKERIVRKPGHYSNSIIRRRNGGVRHQFENDIGGCGDNYR